MEPPPKQLSEMNKTVLFYIGALDSSGVDMGKSSDLLRDLLSKLNRKDFYCVIMGSGDSFET